VRADPRSHGSHPGAVDTGVPHTDASTRATLTLPGLDAATATAMRQAAHTISPQRGHSVVSEGDTDHAVDLVTVATVNISRRTPSRAESLLALSLGHVFGKLSLLDGAQRSATAQARTSTTLEALAQERLRELIEERPDISHRVLEQLARRLRRAHDVLSDLVFSDVRPRLAQIPVNLATKFREQATDGVWVEHELAQLELARLAGAARESVNKALTTFADRDWVTPGRRSVLIHDLEALHRQAG